MAPRGFRDYSVGLTIGLIVGAVIVLGAIALILLSSDVVKGNIGGRHTLERARKLLVVSADEPTRARGDDWSAHHAEKHPDVEIVPLDVSGADGDFAAYLAVQEAINAQKPDGLIWVLHTGESRHAEEGPYAMAKRELNIPMDAIFASEGEAQATGA
jgi:hypothetical protein